MTVDLDRLADFVGGALDGTPDADAVRALIGSDPAWAQAYQDLVAADAAVSADLAVFAREPVAMPADVVLRLDAALHAAGRPDVAPRASAVGPVSRAGTGGPASRTPSGGPPGPSGSRGPGRRRRRLMAVLSAVGGVLAVVVGAGVLLPQFASQSGGGGTSAGSQVRAEGDAAPAAAGPPAPTTAGAGVPGIASGRDYSADGFSELTASAPPRASRPTTDDSARTGPNAFGGSAPQTGVASATVPPRLARLVAPDALDACLDAVRAAHGGTVAILDYARFDGRPALVVLLDGSRLGGGGRWVVVVGPECGLPPGSTDEQFNGPPS